MIGFVWFGLISVGLFFYNTIRNPPMCVAGGHVTLVNF